MVTAGSLRSDWRFVVAVVGGGHFLSHFYLLAFPPLFPLLVAEFGLSNAQLGLAVSAMSVATLLQAPVGAVVDRVGAYRVFVAGTALTALGVVLVGRAGSYPAILAFAVLSGLGQSAFHPADYAILESVTDETVEGRSFSVHTFSGFSGFAVAPVVVGTLGLTQGWGFALQAVGAFGLLYAAFAALALRWVSIPDRGEPAEVAGSGTGTAPTRAGAPEPAAEPTDRERRGILQPEILVLFGFFTALTLGSKGIHTFSTVLAVEAFGLAEATGNLALTAFLAASAVGVLVGGLLADSRNPRRVALVAPATVGVGVWLLVAGPVPVSAAVLVGLFATLGFVAGLIFPSRDRLVSAAVPTGSAGRSFGFVFTGGAVGSLVSPALLGVVIDATSVVQAFVLVGAFYVVAGLVAASTARFGGGPAVAVSGADGD